jgi:hypothetical protein
MDPMSRKRKIINEYAKDLEIAELRKQHFIEKNTHLYYKALNNNDNKFLKLLIRSIKKNVPENIRKEMNDSLKPHLDKFVHSNKKLNEQYEQFLKTV